MSGADLEPKMLHTKDATFATGVVSIERIGTWVSYPILGHQEWKVPCASTNSLINKGRNLKPKEKKCRPRLPGKLYANCLGLTIPLWCLQNRKYEVFSFLPPLSYFAFHFSLQSFPSVPSPYSLFILFNVQAPTCLTTAPDPFEYQRDWTSKGKNRVSVCLVSCWMILDFNLSQ